MVMLPSAAELYVGASVSFIGDFRSMPGSSLPHHPLCKTAHLESTASSESTGCWPDATNDTESRAGGDYECLRSACMSDKPASFGLRLRFTPLSWSPSSLRRC